MITVKIWGGFGNQLSAFACGYSIAKILNKELVLDVADYYNGYARPYALDALNIPVYRKLTYTHASTEIINTEVIPAQLRRTFDIIVDESEGVANRDALLKRINKGKNIYLHGYWGDFDFFAGDEDNIRSMFKPLRRSDAYGRFLETIQDQCSVAIHIRRMDFVELKNVCSDAYYQAAIVYIQSVHPEAIFYFFSDDIDYAKEHFGNKEHFRYIQIFGGMDTDLDEFFCMSACNHMILSKHSSFSNWASFLNNYPNKIHVIYSPKDSEGQKGFVCLDDQKIVDLNATYDPRPRADIKNIMEAKASIMNLISKGQNEASLKIINEISLDAYSVKRADSVDFLAFRAMASAQTDDLIAAEQCLHKQAQYVTDDEDFHANYLVVLNKLGKKKESAIHGARCATLTQSTDLRYKLDNYFIDPLEHKLYKLVRDTPKKHFIIVPNTNWGYYIKTPQSIAILLAKMGHSVSYIQHPRIINIDANNAITTEKIVKKCLELKYSLDTIYSYGFYMYPSIIGKVAGQMHSFVEALIEHLSCTQPDEAVVLFRNPWVVRVNRERKYAKFIYWDFQDESDSEYIAVNIWNEEIREYMCKQAHHSIIMNREFYTRIQKDLQLQNATMFQYPSFNETNNYQYIQERVGYSPNFIADDRTIALATLILELSGT